MRERQVLDQLARHKTSKQIARDLEIHENTVNKHLASVREKWGTGDRYETARIFAQLAVGEGNHPPQFSSGDDYLITAADSLADLPEAAEFRLSDVTTHSSFGAPEMFPPKGLEALDARFGMAWRIAAIPVVALLFGMVVVVMLAVAQALTQML